MNSEDQTALEVRFAAQPNWWTPYGVYLKQRLLQSEGFPLPAGWFMFTVTCDRLLFDDELDAYKYCQKKITRVMKKVAEKLVEWGYFEKPEYCVNFWKLEFQADGWPHWHIFFNLTERLPEDKLKELTALWKFGRARFDHLDQHATYAFKYAFKVPFKDYCEETGENKMFPDWFGDYYGIDQGKPETFARARFFQRSQNFLKHHADWLRSLGKEPDAYKVLEAREPKAAQTCIVPCTAREKAQSTLSKVQLIARDEEFGYLKSVTTVLAEPFQEFLAGSQLAMLKGEIVQHTPHYYVCNGLPEHLLTEETKRKQKQICQLTQTTLRKAKAMQSLNFRKLGQISALPSKESLRLLPSPKTGETSRRTRSSVYKLCARSRME